MGSRHVLGAKVEIKSVRVAFNARLLCGEALRGWNRYTINLIRDLPEVGVFPVLLSQEKIHPRHMSQWQAGSFEVHIAPPMKTITFEQWWLPRKCRELGVDLLHSTFNFGLPCKAMKSCTQVLTLHDAIDYVFYRDKLPWSSKFTLKAMQFEFMHGTSRRSADRIITVSHHAKKDIVDRFRLNANLIDVVYEAADDGFRAKKNDEHRDALKKKNDIKKPYFFYIGGWEERKNVQFILRAFAHAKLSECVLVLAGGNSQQRAVLTALAKELDIFDSLHLLEWVPDEELPELYRGALAFVYASYYEGFGLQLCEAMATGCPIVAANASCLPEILGSGGELFSLSDPSSLASLMRRVASDKGFRQSLAERALLRDRVFSWRETARLTRESYEKAIN